MVRNRRLLFSSFSSLGPWQVPTSFFGHSTRSSQSSGLTRVVSRVAGGGWLSVNLLDTDLTDCRCEGKRRMNLEIRRAMRQVNDLLTCVDCDVDCRRARSVRLEARPSWRSVLGLWLLKIR
ncbi:hypothetical protein DL98DRAFT_295381 [Cadophora sp. DSE1049]|nr:hypothetical protein DL98DRAFT_295381 [Cadophora sp. DSE1049]